jgi:polyphosphate kinase
MVFGPDEAAEVYLSSADWMPRNFYRRVEVMFPIEAAPLQRRILHEIVPSFLRDTMRARMLGPDGQYRPLKPAKGDAPYRCQEALLKLHASKATSKSSLSADGRPAHPIASSADIAEI